MLHCVAAAQPPHGDQGQFLCCDDFAFWSTQNAWVARTVLCLLRLLLCPLMEADPLWKLGPLESQLLGTNAQILQVGHQELWRVRQFLFLPIDSRPT